MGVVGRVGEVVNKALSKWLKHVTINGMAVSKKIAPELKSRVANYAGYQIHNFAYISGSNRTWEPEFGAI